MFVKWLTHRVTQGLVLFAFSTTCVLVSPGVWAQENPGRAETSVNISRLTDQVRSLWEGMTEEEQEKVSEELATVVRPAIQRAFEEQEAQATVNRAEEKIENVMKSSLTTSDSVLAPKRELMGVDATSNPLPATPLLRPFANVGCGAAAPPQAYPTANYSSGYAPLVVGFHAGVLSPDGYMVAALWNFGDGSFGDGWYPSHTFSTPGTYTVNLEGIDNCGLSVYAYLIITVLDSPSNPASNQPPQVSLKATLPACPTLPYKVSFKATANDPDGSIASYAWNFGDGSTRPSGVSVSHSFTKVGSYTVRVEVTDNQGAKASASVTVNVPTPTMIDSDGDGLSDTLETALADGFMPNYHVSVGERTSPNKTGFALFWDIPNRTINQVLPPTSPVVHYRVTPHVSSSINGLPVSVVRVDFLTIWNRDDGLVPGQVCRDAGVILKAFTGIDVNASLTGLGGHAFDLERSAVLLAAPVANACDPGAYRAYQYYLAAHEKTFFDHGTFHTPAFPSGLGAHLPIWLSRAKHSSYLSDPRGKPIFPSSFIALVDGTVDALWASGRISKQTFLLIKSASTTFFYSCAVEDFVGLTGVLPVRKINVGELSKPINGSRWINDSDGKVQRKFDPLLWSVLH